MNTHWTARSTEDFVYRISSDFALQIEDKMDRDGISQSHLARSLGVTDGRVSQVLNNPGNLTLKKMVEYATSLGMKVSIVAYEDGDPENHRGPIHAQIFNACWMRAGRPNNFLSLRESSVVMTNTPTIRYMSNYAITDKSHTTEDAHISYVRLNGKMNTTSDSLLATGAK